MIVCVCDRLIVCFRSKLDSLFVCLRSNFEIAVCVTGFVGVLIELDWFSGLERGDKKKTMAAFKCGYSRVFNVAKK